MALLSIEGGSCRSHYVEESFWKRLWTCRLTDYWWWWYSSYMLRSTMTIFRDVVAVFSLSCSCWSKYCEHVLSFTLRPLYSTGIRWTGGWAGFDSFEDELRLPLSRIETLTVQSVVQWLHWAIPDPNECVQLVVSHKFVWMHHEVLRYLQETIR